MVTIETKKEIIEYIKIVLKDPLQKNIGFFKIVDFAVGQGKDEWLEYLTSEDGVAFVKAYMEQ